MQRKRALDRTRPEGIRAALGDGSAQLSGLGLGLVAVVLGALLLAAVLPQASILEQTAAATTAEVDPLPAFADEGDPVVAIVARVQPCDDVRPLRGVRSRTFEHVPHDPCGLFDHGPRGPPQFASACI